MSDKPEQPDKDKGAIGIPSDFIDGRPKVENLHNLPAWGSDYQRIMSFKGRSRGTKRAD